jgi:hypothetical protein
MSTIAKTQSGLTESDLSELFARPVRGDYLITCDNRAPRPIQVQCNGRLIGCFATLPGAYNAVRHDQDYNGHWPSTWRYVDGEWVQEVL